MKHLRLRQRVKEGRKRLRMDIALLADLAPPPPFVSDLYYIIPRSRQDPKIGGKDDAEIISDRIAKLAPFPRDFVA